LLIFNLLKKKVAKIEKSLYNKAVLWKFLLKEIDIFICSKQSIRIAGINTSGMRSTNNFNFHKNN